MCSILKKYEKSYVVASVSIGAFNCWTEPILSIILSPLQQHSFYVKILLKIFVIGKDMSFDVILRWQFQYL